MRFNTYSFSSIWEKDFNVLFNCMNLFLGGFIAACLLLFNWTIYAFLLVSFFEVYISSLSSLNMFSGILGLFISNSVGGVWIKLYSFSYDFRFDILSRCEDIS